MWNKMTSWVDDFKGRQFTIQTFNKRAKEKFVDKESAILLEAKTTVGCTEFKHSFSKFMASGFSVKAFSSIPLKTEHIQKIGKEITDDEVFVRKLISLGWDTLEVHDTDMIYCFKWQLQKHINIQ